MSLITEDKERRSEVGREYRESRRTNRKEWNYLSKNCKASTCSFILFWFVVFFCNFALSTDFIFQGTGCQKEKQKGSGKPIYFSKSSPENLSSRVQAKILIILMCTNWWPWEWRSIKMRFTDHFCHNPEAYTYNLLAVVASQDSHYDRSQTNVLGTWGTGNLLTSIIP